MLSKLNYALFLASLFFVFGAKLMAQSENRDRLFEMKDEKKVDSSFITHPSSLITIFVFLSETCPMSQSYVPVLNKIQDTYKNKGVEIVGIFPNFYVTDSIVNQFVKEFGVNFRVKRDSAFITTNSFNAHITPEIFLVNSEKRILYSGAIDNAYFRAGKRRGITSANYLIDAIDAMLINKKIETTRTEVFGCVIVKD